MSSLTVHLRQAADHATLGFRPDCPVCCRERLAGELYAHSAIAPRTLAAFTAGVVAISAASPPVAVAVEPDQEQSGAEPISLSPGGDSAQSPDSDPGGPVSSVPDSTQDPESPAASHPDGEPVDSEPSKGTSLPVADPGDGVPDTGGARQSQPTAKPVPPLPATPPMTGGGSRRPPRLPAAVAPRVPRVSPESLSHKRDASGRGSQEAQLDASVATSTPGDQLGGSPPAPAPEAPGMVRSRNSAPGRTHVVVAGESLWSIARDALGADPSNAQVAREVGRLWDLNRGRIATGSPDLLPVGTKLQLA